MKIPTFRSIYEKNIGFVENDILLYFDWAFVRMKELRERKE